MFKKLKTVSINQVCRRINYTPQLFLQILRISQIFFQATPSMSNNYSSIYFYILDHIPRIKCIKPWFWRWKKNFKKISSLEHSPEYSKSNGIARFRDTLYVLHNTVCPIAASVKIYRVFCAVVYIILLCRGLLYMSRKLYSKINA